jgi:hypothetical protein
MGQYIFLSGDVGGDVGGDGDGSLPLLFVPRGTLSVAQLPIIRIMLTTQSRVMLRSTNGLWHY